MHERLFVLQSDIRRVKSEIQKLQQALESEMDDQSFLGTFGKRAALRVQIQQRKLNLFLLEKAAQEFEESIREHIASLPPELQKEYPLPLINDREIAADFSGMKGIYLEEIAARLHPEEDPIILHPFDERSLTGQMYDQMPLLVRTLHRLAPPKVLKAIEDGIQERLQEKVGSLSGKVDKFTNKLNYRMTDFSMPKNAVSIDWLGAKTAASNVEDIDPLMLSTAYPALYKLVAKNIDRNSKDRPLGVLITRLKLPRSISVNLNQVKTEKADIDSLDLTLASKTEQEVEIHWKIVEDASGELHALPFKWNLPAVFAKYKLDESKLKYSGLEPKEGAGAYVDPIADGLDAVNGVGQFIDMMGPDFTRQALRQTWMGRRMDDVAGGLIAWGFGLEAKIVKSTVGSGVYRRHLERPEVIDAVKEALAEQTPGLVDTIGEEMLKAVNGELRPNLPLDEESLESRKFYFDTLRLLDPDKARALERVVDFIYPTNPSPPGPRDPETPMPALQRNFEEIFAKIEGNAPIRKRLGEWNVKGHSAIEFIEGEAEKFTRDAINGKHPEVWPAEMTNDHVVDVFEQSMVPAARSQVANLPRDNESTVKNIIRPQELIGDQVTSASNEMIKKTLRGEAEGPENPEPPPIPEEKPPVSLDFPEIFCIGNGVEDPESESMRLIFGHGFQKEQKDQLPATLSQNPLEGIKGNITRILYPEHEGLTDLSDKTQEETNLRMGETEGRRRPKGLAIADLNELLETQVKPNVHRIVDDLSKKIIQEQDLANESLKISVENISLDVVQLEDGRNSLVAGFDLDIKQTGAGKKGLVKFLSSILGIKIDTTGKSVERDGETPKPLRVTWPLDISLYNRFMERPETTGAEIPKGHGLHIQSNFPIKIEGPIASRTWETHQLMKGPLVDALRDFKFSTSFEGAEIPTLEDFTDIILESPRLVAGGKRGYLAVPLRIEPSEKAKSVPKSFDDEIIMQAAERFAPMLEEQDASRKYDLALKAIRAELPKKFENYQIEWMNPSDGGPSFRKGEKGELEYHVGLSAVGPADFCELNCNIPSGRYTLVYRVESILSHQPGGEAEFVSRLASPKLIDHQNSLNENIHEKDLLYYLKQTSSRPFNWMRLNTDQVKKVSERYR